MKGGYDDDCTTKGIVDDRVDVAIGALASDDLGGGLVRAGRGASGLVQPASWRFPVVHRAVVSGAAGFLFCRVWAVGHAVEENGHLERTRGPC